MFVITKAGRWVNSHDFQGIDVKTKRISNFKISRMPWKTDVVEETFGGEALVVEARRLSILAA